MSLSKKFLLGTSAYNLHIQNIALALHEASALGAYYTTGVDKFRETTLAGIRHLIERRLPTLDRELKRREVTTVPEELVYQDWTWEAPRALSAKLELNGRLQDWFWERSEFRLDRRCARLLERGEYDVFFGAEHGSLFSVTAARHFGKKSVVAFLSPHHTMRRKWVDEEYEKFPELLTPSARKLLQLGLKRDARRDKEARLADCIHANSRFTEHSLVVAGFPKEKIVSIPYGSPDPISEQLLPHLSRVPQYFMYAGPISVRKGAHYLMKAWSQLGNLRCAELHFYGIPLLPKRYLNAYAEKMVFHGSVSQPELFAAYRRSALLVFPTLCDGFGLVVTEALAHGVPVITTRNAGAADLIEEGKNGFLVPPGDALALAEQLEWCIRHPIELLEMRRHALISARRWNWANFRASLRQQLSHVLNISLDTSGSNRRPSYS